MQVFFLTESKKDTFFKRLLKKIEINNDIIILNLKFEKLKISKKIQIVKNIAKIIGKNNKIIISKKLKRDKELINLLYSQNIDIISGKKLFKLIIDKFLDFECEKNKIKIEESEIGITVNNIDEVNLKLIEKLAKKFKIVNIVTNNIGHLRRIQEKLWVEDGIIINITNNKKKALIKSDVILNIDFSEETLNKYRINDNSIIINLEENIKIHKKRFCGQILNKYNIKLKKDCNIKEVLEQYDLENFDLNDLAEIYLINNPNEINNIIIC